MRLEGGGGGGTISDSTLEGRGTKHFFSLFLYNFKNIGWGEGHVPPPAPLLRGPWDFWYGTDKNGAGAKKKSSIHSFTIQFFPVPNNFISAFGTRTQLKCSFRIRSAESLLPSTDASCAVSKWRMEGIRKIFSSIFLKVETSVQKN